MRGDPSLGGGARRRRPEEESESYFISMSDMMAGVLFIFIIMLTNFALQLRNAPPAASKSAHAAQTLAVDKAPPKAGPLPVGPIASQPSMLTPVNPRAPVLDALAEVLHARGVPVSVDYEAGLLRIGGEGLFGAAGAGVSPQGRPVLNAVAEAMGRVLPCYAESAGLPRPAACPVGGGRVGAVFLEGRATGPDAFGRSLDRGAAAFRALIEADPRLASLRSQAGGASLLSAGGAGAGGTEPLDLRIVMAGQ